MPSTWGRKGGPSAFHLDIFRGNFDLEQLVLGRLHVGVVHSARVALALVLSFSLLVIFSGALVLRVWSSRILPYLNVLTMRRGL